jgi:hypothetical protein
LSGGSQTACRQTVFAIDVIALMFHHQENRDQADVAPLLEACWVISSRIAETPVLSAADVL